MRSVVAMLAVASALVLAVPAAAFANGSISGTVTAAVGGASIEGVEVCAEHIDEEAFGCEETAADGTYLIANLPAGSYKVNFWGSGGAYVFQYYDGKPSWGQATPVPVADGVESEGIDATLVKAGRITGRVSDASSNAGIPGIFVCATLPVEEIGGCTETEANGDYAIGGLPTGSYEVSFESNLEEGGEYAGQVYRGGARELVPVSAGMTTANIDASLGRLGQITGTVTDSFSGAGVGFSIVCAKQATTGLLVDCARANSGGRYAIGGLPSGSYKVWFSPDVPAWKEEDDYFEQYFSAAATFALATPVAVGAPAITPGIDARLVSRKAPPVAPTPTAVPIVKQQKKHCRKGLKRVKVKGKERCVRIHRKRHRAGGGKRHSQHRLAGRVQFSLDRR